MAFCYILFSKKLSKYYVGCTMEATNERLEKHISEFYHGQHFTHSAKDWIIFFSIECSDIRQARKIEGHIKRMKSKTCIENLKKYPQILKKLQRIYTLN